jgi:hypothetical protein
MSALPVKFARKETNDPLAHGKRIVVAGERDVPGRSIAARWALGEHRLGWDKKQMKDVSGQP